MNSPLGKVASLVNGSCHTEIQVPVPLCTDAWVLDSPGSKESLLKAGEPTSVLEGSLMAVKSCLTLISAQLSALLLQGASESRYLYAPEEWNRAAFAKNPDTMHLRTGSGSPTQAATETGESQHPGPMFHMLRPGL